MAFCQLLQTKGHPPFPHKVFPTRRSISAGMQEFAIVGPESDALYGIGIGERFPMAGILLQVNIDTGERYAPLQGKARRLHQGIGRLDEEVDGPVEIVTLLPGSADLIAKDRYLGKTADRPLEMALQGRGKLNGDAVRLHPLHRPAHQGGELHGVVENRKGVDRAELFEMEFVGHGLSPHGASRKSKSAFDSAAPPPPEASSRSALYSFSLRSLSAIIFSSTV